MSSPDEKGHPHAYPGPEGYDQPGQVNYQPPAYGQPQSVQYGQPGQMVMQTQPVPSSVVMVQQQTKPPNYLGLSIFACLCCNFIFGGIAIAFATMSDSAYGSGDVEDARTKGRVAMGLSIGAIVSTIAVVTLVLILFFTGAIGSFHIRIG